MFKKSFGGRSATPRGRSQGRMRRSGGGGRNAGFRSDRIDASRFVRKAQPLAEKAPDFVPVHSFMDFPFEEKLKMNIQKKGYTKPTPIQDQAIPFIINQQDLVGIANTGTGKTAAFLLPLLQKVLKDRNQRVIIVAPTRELAQQINQEFISFAMGTGLYSVVCIGGASIGQQIMGLRRPHHFVIGTPGRIKDLITRKSIMMSKFNNVVIDEADRMLDMGFVHEIKYLLSLLPKPRQSLFFSATVSPQIHELIRTFLQNPVTVSVKVQETSVNVEQDIVKVPRSANKLDVLFDLLKHETFQKVLIFGRTKRGVEKLSIALSNKGFRVVALHGDKTQSRRQAALNLFRDNKVKILVATDVVARGLDIPNVSHVINFDPPATYDDYVHRIGRTGRAEQKGIALTFVDG